MTDKQIIIDGCDVSGCDCYCDGKCLCEYNEINRKIIRYYSCNKFPNCYYKQLKLKEKSEEKLVKQIQTICDFINNRPETFKGVNGSVDKIITDYAERKEQECEGLKNTLEEIQRIANSGQRSSDLFVRSLAETIFATASEVLDV